MKKSDLIYRFALAIGAVIICSSVVFAGGDKYSIYLNNKLINEQYVHSNSFAFKSLQLSNANSNDEITIYYSHCGEVGTGRSIVLTDDKNNVLKEWKFFDGSAAMIIKVKDILEVQKNNANSNIALVYYSNKYLPKGRSLTSIKVGDKNTAFVSDIYRANVFARLI